MIYNLDDATLNYINKLLEEFGKSEYADECFNEYLSDENKPLSKDFHKNLENYFIEERKIIGYAGFDRPKMVDAKLINENPFVKALESSPIKRASYQANELFLLGEKKVDKNGKEITPIGFFPFEVKYPFAEKDGVTWMSIIPHEIYTMDKAVKEAKGKVLTYGLGLGYFAFMAALKAEVTSVTVIEFDKEIIDNYTKNIEPYLQCANKIKIIEADAFNYGKTDKEHYDLCFVDTYHDEEDGLAQYIIYKKCQNIADKTIYWIEDTILTYLRRHVLVLLEGELNGNTDEDYQKVIYQSDALVNKLHFALKKRTINGKNDIDDLLSFKSLRDLAALC